MVYILQTAILHDGFVMQCNAYIMEIICGMGGCQLVASTKTQTLYLFRLISRSSSVHRVTKLELAGTCFRMYRSISCRGTCSSSAEGIHWPKKRRTKTVIFNTGFSVLVYISFFTMAHNKSLTASTIWSKHSFRRFGIGCASNVKRTWKV